MQRSTQRLKDEKLHEMIVQKQKKSFALATMLLITWTVLVASVIIFSYVRKESNVIKFGLAGAETAANRYLLLQEVNYLFKDIYFDSETAIDESEAFDQADIDNFLGAENQQITMMNSARLSPAIHELFGTNGVYVSYIGSKISKDEIKPDLWTLTALEDLNLGAPYVCELVELHNSPYLRVMFPAKVNQRHKNIKAQDKVHRFFRINPVGTIYSGISVYYPLSKYTSFEDRRFYVQFACLFALWIFGTVGTVVYGGRFLDLVAKYSELKAKVTSINHDAMKEIEVYQQEIKKIEQEKEEALKGRSQFFAKVSHEIRTPLNGVLGMSELLLRTKLTDEQSYQVASLRASANNLLDVFNDIWDYSRMEVGTLQVDSQPFALRDTLYSVVKIYMHQANSKGLELIANIAPNIPDNLLGDPTRIRQVLSNLLSNAIKFTDRGEILLSVSETSLVDDVAKVNFTVKDTGIGLSTEKRLAILSSEQMHNASSKRKYEGLGLGLAISSRLIALMGGKLQVDSELGVGSSFSFSLNLPYLPGTLNDKQDSASVLKGEHVLIVDDNATNRRILREQVKSWGMKSSDCTGVDEAMRLLKVSANSFTPFSVVISDLQMPEKDGIDLVQEMKRDIDLAQIPVILLSSAILGLDSSKELFFAALYKPARPSELIKALAAAVNHRAHFEKDVAPEIMKEERHVKSENSFKILLVEDLEINKLVVSSILKELGHIAEVAKNGQEALDILEQEDFDLILMDIHMPVMDGIQAVKIIREREQERGGIKHIPVIALTANADSEVRDNLLKAGFNGYILKPTALHDLHYEIEKMATKFNIETRPTIVKITDGEKIKVVEAAVYTPSIKQNQEVEHTNATFTAQPSIASKVAEESKVAPKTKKEKMSLSDIEAAVNTSKSFEPSIFSSNKNMPLVRNSNISEPSIAKNLPPINAGIGPVVDFSLEKKSLLTDLSLEDKKFSPSVSIDKDKYAPSISASIKTEVQSTIEKEISEISEKVLAKETLTVENSVDKSLNEHSQIIEETTDEAIQNNKSKKGNENMDTQMQEFSTHFSSGKERKVVLPLDIELLTKSFASYPDLAYRSIEIFLRDAPKSLLEIKNAIEVDDNSTLTVSAHAVKGLISYYSKETAYNLALKLEQMGRDKVLPAQKDEAITTLAEFEEVFDKLIDAMKVYME